MTIDDLINHTGEWLKGTGPQSHIVMSSRVRLARNIERIPFPAKASKKDLIEIMKIAKTAFDASEYFKEAMFLKINEMDAVDQQFLIERHLMSHDHAATSEGRAILLSTHRLHEIENRCDRFVIIHGGRVAAQGTRAQLAGPTGSLEQGFFAAVEGAGA